MSLLEELADFSVAELPAKLRELVGVEFSKLDLPSICGDLGIEEIVYRQTPNYVGALVTNEAKNSGIISIQSGLTPEREYFTIGHEIGHYLNPFHEVGEPGLQCTSADLIATKKKHNSMRLKMEAEANSFAAQLLMPTSFLSGLIRKSIGADSEQYLEISEKCSVSKEAAVRRLVDLHNETLACVFLEGEKVRYFHKAPGFPYLTLGAGDSVPIQLPLQDSGQSISRWTAVDWTDWISGDAHGQLYIQIHYQANGFKTLLLSVEIDFDCESDDEESLIESYTPRFAYGR